MKLKAVSTTDGQWIGLEFELPDPLMSGFEFPVTEDIVFDVEHSKQLPNGDYMYWNANYIVVAREVG
jgi:hypothetical protein